MKIYLINLFDEDAENDDFVERLGRLFGDLRYCFIRIPNIFIIDAILLHNKKHCVF